MRFDVRMCFFLFIWVELESSAGNAKFSPLLSVTQRTGFVLFLLYFQVYPKEWHFWQIFNNFGFFFSKICILAPPWQLCSHYLPKTKYIKVWTKNGPKSEYFIIIIYLTREDRPSKFGRFSFVNEKWKASHK